MHEIGIFQFEHGGLFRVPHQVGHRNCRCFICSHERQTKIRRLPEPDVFKQMTCFDVLDGDCPTENFYAEIADATACCKLWRQKPEYPVQHRINLGRENGLCMIAAAPSLIASRSRKPLCSLEIITTF